MAYRGYDEPEYIDDDEYFDPDAGRRGASNVLGGSGSRRDAGSVGADAWQDQPAPNRREPERARPKRSVNTRKPSQQPRQGQSNAARPRERGGKPDARRGKAATAKPGNSQDRERADEGSVKRRFGKLPSPFRFNNRNNEKKPGRLKALAGRVGKLRPGGVRSKPETGAAPAQSSRRAGGKANAPSVRAAFGASRNARRESKPGGMPRARLDRADSEELSSQNRPSKAPIFKSGDWLDLDRKLDLIGVGLVFAAIVLFFSALSREQAAIGAVHRLIGQLLGWGALAAPLTMFAVGIWLILRHFGDQAPLIDPVRLSGAISAFIGLLVLFQFGEALGYASDSYCAAACIRGLVESSYLAGRGGGLIGGWIYQVLVINLTELGGFVVVAMVLTFATMMITRMSMAELATVALGIARSAQAALAQQAAKGRARQLRIEEQALLARHKPQVRVSKPEAAKLSGSVAGAKALPEPTGYAMPIPARLRDMLSKRVSILRADSESQALAHAEAAPGSAAPPPDRHRTPFFGRIFGGAGEPSAPERAKPSAANAPQVRKTRHEPNWRASAGKPAPPPKIARGGLARDRKNRPAAKPRPPAEQRSAENPETTWQRSSTRPQPDLPSQGLPQDEASLAAHSARPDDFDWHLKSPQPGASSAPFYDIEDDASDIGSPGNGAARRADAAERYEETRPPDSVSAHDLAPPAVSSTVQAAHVTQSNSPAEPASIPRPRVDWQMPDFSAMLAAGSTGEVNEEDLLQQAQIIEDTLASCNAPGRVVAYNSGPVITQFCVVPDVLETRAGKTRLIKVSAIARTDKDLQRTLSAKSIRIQAPVPGQDYVGIEVPNPVPAIVSLRDVMESDSFQAIDSPLAIALGMSVNGAPMSADLAQMPHLLIAGATGAGKSICLNAIISSILAYRRPDEVKFIMIDPKLVELTGYNGLPHLVDSVVGDPEKTVSVLRWVIHEMDERYEKFKKVRAKNLSQYNNILAQDSPPLPYIVVIIDELAELMLVAKSAEAEQAIVRLAAKARASGIHLIIATQRPSVDVVTGSIKANFPARIAFRVSDSRNSQVILDCPGAERLLGKGDMLYKDSSLPEPIRMQGVFVSDEEINRVINFWKRQNLGISGIDPISQPGAAEAANIGLRHGQAPAADDAEPLSQSSFWDIDKPEDAQDGAKAQQDALYDKAVAAVRKRKSASISFLQRKFSIGYGRAARIVDMMEERGVVGPEKLGSSKPRDVLPE